MITNAGYDLTRANVAREEWMKYRMGDLPPIYRAMLPPTADAKELLEAERAIRKMYTDDQETYAAKPWREVGPEPSMVDWSKIDAFHMDWLRAEITPIGTMPGVVRFGSELHPLVMEAWEKAYPKASGMHDILSLQVLRRVMATKQNLVDAQNSGAGEAEVAKLCSDLRDRRDAFYRFVGTADAEWERCGKRLEDLQGWADPMGKVDSGFLKMADAGE
jgi:hypothetical protein